MRVDLAIFALLSLFLPNFLAAQEEQKEGVEVSESHNFVKLLAQKAAMPSLQGEDKFILRESWWSGNLGPGKAKLIQVQLFRRNSYKFWLAVPSREGEPLINVYDSEGNLADTKESKFDASNVVATTFQPETTGVYYIRVSLKTTVENPQDWAVIYGYR
ncbi:MAG: hypothetical protein AAGF67_03195 [Verrucomicrobiota bacterium]